MAWNQNFNHHDPSRKEQYSIFRIANIDIRFNTAILLPDYSVIHEKINIPSMKRKQWQFNATLFKI